MRSIRADSPWWSYIRHLKYPDTRENLGKTLFSQWEKVLQFSLDLNENFGVGSLGCQEQSNFFFFLILN
jgi:hypothetical protein